jgi:polysaccharide export outer membrane protein
MSSNNTLVIACIAACFCVAGRADTPAGAKPPGKSDQAQPDKVQPDRAPSYKLGPGDQVLIRCLQAEEFGNQPYRIDGDGQLTLPLLGRIKASDLAVRELELDIERRLGETIKAPQVTVAVATYRSQPVSLIGEVNTPGVHQLEGRKTLIEVLSLGGGLRASAGPRVQITRRTEYGAIPLPGSSLDHTGNFYVAEAEIKKLFGSSPASNIEIRPYDTIAVPKAEVIYVLGDVHKAGGFALVDKQSVSALEAVSLAEGLLPTAAPKKARILRESDSGAGRVEIAVDLSRVMNGGGEDIRLKPNDILFVPNHVAKNAALRALQIAVQTGSGMLIYHAR